MPFKASTLQIGGYHSYQHRKLQAAQVTITEPDSAVSVFEASNAETARAVRLCDSALYVKVIFMSKS